MLLSYQSTTTERLDGFQFLWKKLWVSKQHDPSYYKVYHTLVISVKSIIYPSAPRNISLKYCSPKHASVRKLVNLIMYPDCGMPVS